MLDRRQADAAAPRAVEVALLAAEAPAGDLLVAQRAGASSTTWP
jgi:hypothetical protein